MNIKNSINLQNMRSKKKDIFYFITYIYINSIYI